MTKIISQTPPHRNRKTDQQSKKDEIQGPDCLQWISLSSLDNIIENLTNKENFQYISRYFAYNDFKRNCSQNTLVKCLGCLQNYKVTEILLTLTFATHQPFSFQKIEPLQHRMDIISILKKKSRYLFVWRKKVCEEKWIIHNQIITQNGDVMYTSKRERSSGKKS